MGSWIAGAENEVSLVKKASASWTLFPVEMGGGRYRRGPCKTVCGRCLAQGCFTAVEA